MTPIEEIREEISEIATRLAMERMKNKELLELLNKNNQGEIEMNQITNEVINTWREIYAKGANEAEFKTFVYVCQITNLRPEMSQICMVKRWDVENNRFSMSIQVQIAGLRVLAERTKQYRGETPPQWAEWDEQNKKIIWYDVWPYANQYPLACRCAVKRDGFEPQMAIARWDEFVQLNKNGQPTKTWMKRGVDQLWKCASAKAIRIAFPVECGGLYVHEEMEQAGAAIPIAGNQQKVLPQNDFQEKKRLYELLKKEMERLYWGQEEIREYLEFTGKEIDCKKASIAELKQLLGELQEITKTEIPQAQTKIIMSEDEFLAMADLPGIEDERIPDSLLPTNLKGQKNSVTLKKLAIDWKDEEWESQSGKMFTLRQLLHIWASKEENKMHKLAKWTLEKYPSIKEEIEKATETEELKLEPQQL